jgi:hypothetical protein
MAGGKDMKLLKIEDNLGYYCDDKGEFATVDKITKEDLLRLVDLTLGEEEIEFDEYNDENLNNQAHQIIYKNIFDKLKSLKDRRQAFIDESERLYLKVYESYRDKPAQQGD